MPADRLSLGIFTTDADLVVRTWDSWMRAATGVELAQALNRPLTTVIPEIETRGLLPLFELYRKGAISMEEALSNADSRSNLEAKINFS